METPPVKIVLINKSDSTGGAAVVSRRLVEALRSEGADASLLVCEKLTALPWVHQAAGKKRALIPFIAERLGIWCAEGFRRKNLFKADTATHGLPLHRHPLVMEADVVCLGWVNQGMLSLREIERIVRMGKPVVWIMHDMWCATGICHHAHSCGKFKEKCGSCPLLSPFSFGGDISRRTFRRKKRLYSGGGITLAPVSNWLAGKCQESALTSGVPLKVIPNPFPDTVEPAHNSSGSEFRILFGAARLDDPIKGLPLLIHTLGIFAKRYPDIASRSRLVTFGNIRDASLLASLPVAATHLGLVKGETVLRDIYSGADAVISTSLYETLPGTLVEGQAYGCVPVSFISGGQEDIVDDGSTGFITPLTSDHDGSCSRLADKLADAFFALESDPETLRERMRRNVENRFSSSAVAKEYLKLFADLCNKI